MRPPIPIAVAASLALAVPLHASGPENHPLEASAQRTIAYTQAEPPPVVRTGLLQSTLIVLPEEEKIANVFAGDTVDWVFDGGHVASRFLSVKPKTANSSTDMHIVSDRGNEYTLTLHEISSDDDPRFDAKVLLVPKDQKAKDKILELPVFVPAADLERAKQEATEARARYTAEVHKQEEKTELDRSQYPGTLHFDFLWDRDKARGLGLEQIWRDDRFTYLRGSFQETPALYEVKEGKGSLINFDFANGLYTVPKQLEAGYLSIGKRKVDFHRAGGRER